MFAVGSVIVFGVDIIGVRNVNRFDVDTLGVRNVNFSMFTFKGSEVGGGGEATRGGGGDAAPARSGY